MVLSKHGFNLGDVGLAAAVQRGGLAPYLRTVVILGDSVTAQNTGSSTSPDRLLYYDYGYLPNAMAIGGYDFELLNNAGVPGEKTSQILARVESDVISYAPDCCIVLSGVNDMSSGTYATITAGLEQIYSKLNAAGIYVLALSIPPRADASTAQAAMFAQVNLWIASYWRCRLGGKYVDTASSITESTTTAGDPKSGYTYDANVHPSNLGAYYYGVALADAMSGLFQRRQMVSSPLDTYSLDTGSNQVVPNPTMIGTGGTLGTGFTGSVADNWITLRLGTPTCVCSIGAANSGVGNKQILTVTAGTANDEVLFYTPDTIAAGVTAGNSVQAVARIKISSATNLSAIRSYWVTNGNTAAHFGIESGSAQYAYPSDLEFLAAATPPFATPSPLTTLQLTHRFKFNGAGGATIEIEQVALRDLGA